jgi:hypothetical protein
MIRHRAHIAGAALLLFSSGAHAQDHASAEAFLTDIYRHYAMGNSSGVSLDHPELWFEPALADAMRRDAEAVAKRGDVSLLDGDPFCDCQDFDGFQAEIGAIRVDRGAAHAVVRFINGEAISLTYDLQWTSAGWRIRDIVWPEGHLRRLFLKDG